MIPIFEQGDGKGIGHNVESFLGRFTEIAEQHVTSGRAEAVAFVFYDFQDRDFKRVLKDQGVFASLDRLSSTELSIFYLHSGKAKVLQRFNSTLLGALGLEGEATPPCVVFCKVSDEGFSDIVAVMLESANIIHAFHELYGIIEDYLKGNAQSVQRGVSVWVRESSKFLSLESIKALVRELLKGGMF